MPSWQRRMKRHSPSGVLRETQTKQPVVAPHTCQDHPNLDRGSTQRAGEDGDRGSPTHHWGHSRVQLPREIAGPSLTS